MKNNAAFTVYDAAAGSGKTYTLVKNYLIKILRNNSKNRYQQILSVTFTNMAVSEMKNRILENLYGFSKTITPLSQLSMFLEVQKTLGFSKKQLQLKSKELLHFILHNYTAFNVQTIDKFTQSIVRTFAFDLNLTTNFEVELNQKKVLEQAVDELINSVGVHQEISKIVLEFAKENIEDDNSWNIKRSLLETAEIIFKEDEIEDIQSLKKYKLQDFRTLKKQLSIRTFNNKELIKSLSTEILMTFENEGIQDDFSRNYLPKHFLKLKKTATDDFTAKWKNEIKTTSFYTLKTSENTKQKIDELRPKIEQIFLETRQLVLENTFIQRIVKNVTQMSLIQHLSVLISEIKKEKNILLISDFNRLIYDSIKDQPTPFIYERLGEKYKDFFIDEFQDTSELQWKNLMPLVDNAVSSVIENSEETGTLTIVGDAKQAIYRWRGGKAEQFIELSTTQKPFPSIEKNIENLDTNYRSYSNIITFNNTFFTYLSSQLQNPIYSELYKKGNQQKINSNIGGYIQFEFIDAKNEIEKNEQYPEKVLLQINKLIEEGVVYSDICILVRKNKQGELLANALNENQIPVISAESLLVKNSNNVNLIVTFMDFYCHKNDVNKKWQFCKALSIYFNKVSSHSFLKSIISLEIGQISMKLKEDYGVELPLSQFENLAIFEAVESFIRAFKLHEKSESNLQFFLDFLFEYTQKENLGMIGFLSHWDLKKEKLSIVAPQGRNAVQIMSIHKSKGLEFPIVIFPYADTEIYKNTPKNVWFPIIEFSNTFSKAYISFNKKLFENYSELTNQFQSKIKELQELDNFNILYVALTRAKEQLYIISNCNSKEKQMKTGSFQSYFKSFLIQSNFVTINEQLYSFGDKKNKLKETKPNKPIESLKLESFVSTPKEAHGIQEITKNSISDNQKEAILQGNLIHDLMAQIYDRAHIDAVFNSYGKKKEDERGTIKKIEKQIKKIVSHTLMKPFFKETNTIYNERDFYFEGEILRPDRVEILPDRTVVVIDYKTGDPNPSYPIQLSKYASIFEKMGFLKVYKYLIYLNENFEIVSV